MNYFIELTLSDKNKCLINIDSINEIWENPHGGTYISTNIDDGSTYQETYEEIKKMLIDKIINNGTITKRITHRKAICFDYKP